MEAALQLNRSLKARGLDPAEADRDALLQRRTSKS